MAATASYRAESDPLADFLADRCVITEGVEVRRYLVKRGGEWERQEIELGELLAADISDDLLALDEALNKLAASDRQKQDREAQYRRTVHPKRHRHGCVSLRYSRASFSADSQMMSCR